MKKSAVTAIAILLGGMLLGGARILAQGTQDAPPSLNPDKKQAQAKPDVTPLTLDSPAPPVNAEEDAAIKVFRAVPVTDVAKKDQAGEDFLQKYPQSRYDSEVYI